MAKIKPSARYKKRYVVFEIRAEKNIVFSKAKCSIVNAILEYTGKFGLEKSKVYVIKNLYNANKGIFRINNKFMAEIRQILPLVDKIEKDKVKIEIIGVSGILKKAKNKFLITK
jgi:ribonuclease P/MRP protein subunit POP5